MSLKDKAKEYLSYRLSAIPLIGENSLNLDKKKPALYSWEDLQRKALTPEEADTLFNKGTIRPEIEREISKKDGSNFIAKGIKAFTPVGALGIITGAVSNNLEVIDVDTKHDTTGRLWEDFRGLIEDNLPEVYSKLVIAQTVSGGYHIYYRCNSIAGNLKLAKNKNKEAVIETRGEGGFVVCFPTTGYKYIQGEPGNILTITPEQRETLFSIAQRFNELPEDKPKTPLPSSTGYNLTGLSPFEDYNQRGDVVGLLESKGWKVVNQLGQRINLLRPGQTDTKTSGDFHTGLRVFKVLSTSTEFETEEAGKPKGYSPSQVFSLLECRGDNKIAYRRLLELGYGEPYTNGVRIAPTLLKTEKIQVSSVNKVNRESLVISSPGPEATDEVLKAIELIQETGKRIYVKEGPEEVRSYEYELQAILNKYVAIQESNGGGLTDRNIDSLLDEVVETSQRIAEATDRDRYKRSFINRDWVREGLGITEESLSITIDRLTSTKEKELQSKEFKKLLSEVTALQEKGETGKALELLDNQSKQIKLLDKRASFITLQEIPTEEEMRLHFSKHSESLPSGYTINGSEFLLPSGGLTGIAGATGHGKTDFLVNLTLNAVLKYPDKQFYYFTYEMSQEAILVRFLNTFLDMDLEAHSNQRAIKTYFKTGSTQYITTGVRESFLKKKDEFFKDLIASGRLRVKGIDYHAPEMSLALLELNKGGRVGGYFIDYFQLLRLPKEGYKNYSRQEELKVICQDLNKTAKELQLPIILGAQFNREVTTPFKLHPTNIGEAGDIERILDSLLGIWYTNKKTVSGDLSKADSSDLINKGLEAPDKLYTYVLKSRETATDVWELLDYNGKRGKIKNSGGSTANPF